ncbi:MAG: hypothetical protein ACJ0K4_12150 [Verrucomicrobiales bacterium]
MALGFWDEDSNTVFLCSGVSALNAVSDNCCCGRGPCEPLEVRWKLQRFCWQEPRLGCPHRRQRSTDLGSRPDRTGRDLGRSRAYTVSQDQWAWPHNES